MDNPNPNLAQIDHEFLFCVESRHVRHYPRIMPSHGYRVSPEVVRHPLAWLRAERGWSQNDLVRHIRDTAHQHGLQSGIRYQRISAWEAGRRAPDTTSQELLAEVFGVPREVVRHKIWPDWLPVHDLLPPLSTLDNTVVVLRGARGAYADGRGFPIFDGNTVIDLAKQWIAELTPLKSDGEGETGPLAEWLEARANEITVHPWGVDNPSGDLLDVYLAMAIRELERGPTGARARALFGVAALLARVAGASALVRGCVAGAQRYLVAAIHAGHQAARLDVAVGAWSDLAFLAVWSGDQATATRLSTLVSAAGPIGDAHTCGTRCAPRLPGHATERNALYVAVTPASGIIGRDALSIAVTPFGA